MFKAIAVTILLLTITYFLSGCAVATDTNPTCSGAVPVPVASETVTCSRDGAYYDAEGCPTDGVTDDTRWACLGGRLVDWPALPRN
jgi:hypothetical protein